MIELAQHIKQLLTRHDCVIVPRLGGFIAHQAPARRIETDDTFLPPARLVAFNPRLTLDDGLLEQAYMADRGLDYAKAREAMQCDVDRLLDRLHAEGLAEIEGVGQLRLSLRGTYDFAPAAPDTASADDYGFGSFRMQRLPAQTRQPAPTPPPAPQPARPTMRTQRRKKWRVDIATLSNAAAVAAILILSFVISTPVQNTEVIQGNYARLSPAEMFEQMMGSQSLAVTPLVRKHNERPAPQTETNAPARTTSPKATPRTETKAPNRPDAPGQPLAKQEPKAKVPAKPDAPKAVPATMRYHLIVASVATAQDARQMASRLRAQGHSQARALIGGGRMRVSIASYDTETAAYRALNDLRRQPDYQSAWVLKEKTKKKK